ncbi:MAG: adenosylcobinamide-GDP ribazoletransferase [Rhodospirillaceae bacterium]|nr:adenosylcobinamide-GDP ribazoletransferase [Rhodospirillaceae bacterium]
MRYDDGDEAPLQQKAYRAVRVWRSDLRTALLFLTRVPLKAARPEGESPPLGRALRAFPIVGALIGLFAGIVYAIAVGIGLPDIVAAVLAVGAGALATGALHEDGLADMADGFGGGSTRERKLAIMRDSRIGAYGVIVLVVVLAAKVGAIADLGGTGLVIAAMVAAAGVSRAAMPAVMLWLDPARADGLAADAGRPPSTHVWTGVALAAVLAVGLLTWSGLVAFLVAGIGTAAVAWLAERQVGGHTGDVLGGVQQFAEVLFLLTLAAVR